MRSNGKFELQAVIVLYACSDGTLRPVSFGKTHAKQVHGYITHIQGGKVDFRDEPALVVQDTPKVRAAMEELENPARTLRSLVVEKLRRIFGNATPHRALVRFSGKQEHAIQNPKAETLKAEKLNAS